MPDGSNVKQARILSMMNFALTVAEQCVRQVYFRSRAARSWRARRARPIGPRTVMASQLIARLTQVGIREGETLMVHAGLSKIRLVDDVLGGGAHVEGGPAVAASILSLLRLAVGVSGTLLMPTFPKYDGEPEYFSEQNDGSQIWRFDPSNTPSKSGLLSEIFRNQPGTLRSRFPTQTVAVQGPKAEWFTTRNLEDGRGLAHGPDSPYGRLVVDRGHVISLGVPLVDFATIIHAPEDARFDDWPIRDFWRPRHYDVVLDDGVRRERVWERVPRFSFGYAEERVRRDLRRAGVLSEGALGDVQLHHLRADRLYALFMGHGASSSYPYYWPQISTL
ncbi:MAG: aminoglycoside 3-N-acetyltransferase [Gemmatimonadetes bacterium]|nr:aminoglycoside 3-N-acetyltransferase [Gemmatimonadota bacterium]